MSIADQAPENSVIARLEALESNREIHAHGGLSYEVLSALENILPDSMDNTAETGCGRSTILFSNISLHHDVFCIEDRSYKDRSSVDYFEQSSMSKPKNVHWHFGPTQQTLPVHQHDVQYDCVLLDGPHGYPFPDLEYCFFYPHIKTGGFLIVDDIHIPSISRMADILQEDAMWQFIALATKTAVFQRTDEAPTPPLGDHWWTQGYNRRRINPEMEFYLDDMNTATPFLERSRQQDAEWERKYNPGFLERVLRKLGLKRP